VLRVGWRSLWCVHGEFSCESSGGRVLGIGSHLPELLSSIKGLGFIWITVYFIGVSGLRVFLLSINGWMKWYNRLRWKCNYSCVLSRIRNTRNSYKFYFFLNSSVLNNIMLKIICLCFLCGHNVDMSWNYSMVTNKQRQAETIPRLGCRRGR